MQQCTARGGLLVRRRGWCLVNTHKPEDQTIGARMMIYNDADADAETR
jgi:hypothetical protein